jgi:hypothetical protein
MILLRLIYTLPHGSRHGQVRTQYTGWFESLTCENRTLTGFAPADAGPLVRYLRTGIVPRRAINDDNDTIVEVEGSPSST